MRGLLVGSLCICARSLRLNPPHVERQNMDRGRGSESIRIYPEASEYKAFNAVIMISYLDQFSGPRSNWLFSGCLDSWRRIFIYLVFYIPLLVLCCFCFAQDIIFTVYLLSTSLAVIGFLSCKWLQYLLYVIPLFVPFKYLTICLYRKFSAKRKQWTFSSRGWMMGHPSAPLMGKTS